MNRIFTVVMVIGVMGCAANPRSVSMSVSQDAESQALSESVAWIMLRYEDEEGRGHGVMDRSVQGLRAGLDADVELPEDLSVSEDGRWVATALDDQRTPVMEGEASGGDEEVNVELGALH